MKLVQIFLVIALLLYADQLICGKQNHANSRFKRNLKMVVMEYKSAQNKKNNRICREIEHQQELLSKKQDQPNSKAFKTCFDLGFAAVATAGGCVAVNYGIKKVSQGISNIDASELVIGAACFVAGAAALTAVPQSLEKTCQRHGFVGK